MKPKIKARQMWMQHGLEIDHVIGSRRQLHTCNPSRIFKNDIPVAVIPIDQPEELVESILAVFWESWQPFTDPKDAMRYALESVGILPKQSTAKRGTKGRG